MIESQLPTKWCWERLADVCDPSAPIMYGILQPGPEIEGGIPYVRPTEIDDDSIRLNDIKRTTPEIAARYRRSVLKQGDLLITIVGTLGKIAVVPPELDGANITQSSARIRISESNADSRYIRQVLRSDVATRQYDYHKLGTGVPRLNIHHVRDLRIPIPPLDEQRRIAEVLDRAEAVRAKRRAVLAQLDTITQSIFLDLFARAEAPQWPLKTVEDVVDEDGGSIRTGPFGSQLLHSEFVGDGIAVLGIDNVATNEFRWGERRFITPEKYRSLNRYTVRPGDVLITIMGTCGRCAVVPENVPTAINTKHLCCISLDRAQCLPEFLHAYFLQHPAAQRYLESTAKGAIMAGLNMGIIKKLPLWLPPTELQKEFVRRCAAVEKLKSAQRRSLAEIDALFASLQHRAFRGEL